MNLHLPQIRSVGILLTKYLQHRLALILAASAAFLCSCSTTPLRPKEDSTLPVRNVDFHRAPQLQDLADHAREFGNDMYPKICGLLLDKAAKTPPRFDLIVAPLKSHNTGEAHLGEKRIYLNSDYFTNKADLVEKFDKVFAHEMTHMVMQYHGITSWWRSEPSATSYWGESLADFARFKLIGTNNWACPECNTRFPHYSSGYTCGGAFLLYLDATYGTNLVRQLVRKLQRYSYTDDFFVAATGKNLDELWTEFQKTVAFKPIAAEAYELQRKLGYKNGRPPKNVMARFETLVNQRPEDFTKLTVKSTYRNGKTVYNIQELMTLYLYLDQPGGAAEGFIYNLGKNGELPGKAKGEKGSLSKFLTFEEMEARTFPVSRTIDLTKLNDSSRYHYTVSRASLQAPWKLDRAWRTIADGTTAEEFRVP